jgi:hypothetical protein
MMNMLVGYQLSQAIFVAAKLGVADALLTGPRTTAELAQTVGADEQALARLLRSLAGSGIFSQVEPGVFALTPLARTLASTEPGSLRNLALMLMESHYGPYGELEHAVRTGTPAADKYFGKPFWAWLLDHPREAATFTGAMADLNHGLKDGAVASYDFRGLEVIADVGGADGHVLGQILAQTPEARGILFDLPSVVGSAEEQPLTMAVIDRVEIVPGDFFDAVLQADGYVLSFILHDWSDEECLKILDNIRSRIPEDGRLIIMELVMPPGDTPHLSRMSDLNMLVMVSGKERTEPEYAQLLAAAGFELRKTFATAGPMSLIEAVPVG